MTTRPPGLRRCLPLVLISALAMTGLAFLSARPAAAAAPCDAPVLNKVACENTKVGSNGWIVDPDSSIEGFATDISTNVGGRVDFKIKTVSTSYRVDIYRLGWYGGVGGRKVATVNPSVGLPQSQPNCVRDTATALTDCGNWAVSASWQIPADAVSGVYAAILIRTDSSAQNKITFVVRDDSSTSDMVFQTSDTTWAAYNDWGGSSLYFGGGPGRNGAAYKVSYNRPLSTATSTGRLDYAEYPMLRFLEANGYDLTYQAGVDTDRGGARLTNHNIFLSVGHDEYWSGPQRANVEAAKAAGVNLAFFSGNEMFWRVRWEAAIDGSGRSYRTMVSYKETLANAKIDPSPEWTGTWRDGRFATPANGGGIPENSLIGQQFLVNGSGPRRADSIVVPAEFGKSRLWRNTSVASLSGSQKHTFGPGTLGYEWDADFDNGMRPAGVARLSESVVNVIEPDILQDNGSTYASGTATHRLTLYRDAQSGALVFGAGTVQWSWGLDDTHDGGSAVANTQMRQATVNLFADMGVQPVTLQSGLVAASASTDTAVPTVVITSPASTATLLVGNPVTVTGTATDNGGGIVSGVEISVDSGQTWHPVQGRASWTYAFTPTASGPTQVMVRAVDDSARLSGPVSRNLTIGPRPCPCTIWADSIVPASPSVNDPTALELGVKFQSSAAGFVTGVRFYKGTGNTGTHTGSLWSSSGTRLATGTFTGESATGWQTLTFPTAVAVQANTTYIASYYAPNGRYAGDGQFFAEQAVVNEPLTALRNGTDGPNGVFREGPSGFPTQTFGAANYWVDAIFQNTAPPDTGAPVVSPAAPAPGSSSVARDTGVTATFNEPVNPASIVMTLTGPAAAAVAGTVSYDPATRTATFRPSQQLGALTTYTAAVTAAQDTAGNNLSAPVSWTFTTQQAPAVPGVCPCSVWDDTAVPAIVNVQDPGAIELGLKFQAAADGTVTGVRFYKGSSNTGVHVGTLWSSTGQQLARATFAGESSAGWQQVSFSQPVAVTANATYIVSYHTTVGYYSATAGGLTSAVQRGPLAALSDSQAGGNGVYIYGANAFPTRTYGGTNYWVDVVFVPGVAPPPPADVTPPSVSSSAPAAGEQGVGVGTTVNATFSEPVDSATLQFTVTGPAGAVPGSTTLNAAGTSATLTPASALATSTTYSVSVRASDLAGNAMAAPATWTFTTGAAADTTAPTVTATTPAAGATGAATTAVPTATLSEAVTASTVRGALSAAGVSVASTTSYNATTRVVTVTPSSALTASTTYQVTISGAADAAGNVMVPFNWTFTTAAACPCSLFSSADTPPRNAVRSTTPTERGMKFQASQSGYVTAVRFYKGVGGTGQHTGSIWTTAGQRLATVTFTNETSTGWQSATLAQPVALTAGTVYVVSYTAPAGRYSATASYFGTAKTTGPLVGLATSQSANGVSGAAGAYPAAGRSGTNFWVDVVFATTTPPGSSPNTIRPTVVGPAPV